MAAQACQLARKCDWVLLLLMPPQSQQALKLMPPRCALQGNTKATIPGFVENESIDLLVLGAYKEKAKREVFGTRQAAMMLYRRCNCPVLIVPLKQQLVQQISQVRRWGLQRRLRAACDARSWRDLHR